MLSMAIKKSARWKKWQDTGWRSPAVKEKTCGVKTQPSRITWTISPGAAGCCFVWRRHQIAALGSVEDLPAGGRAATWTVLSFHWQAVRLAVGALWKRKRKKTHSDIYLCVLVYCRRRKTFWYHNPEQHESHLFMTSCSCSCQKSALISRSLMLPPYFHFSDYYLLLALICAVVMPSLQLRMHRTCN